MKSDDNEFTSKHHYNPLSQGFEWFSAFRATMSVSLKPSHPRIEQGVK